MSGTIYERLGKKTVINAKRNLFPTSGGSVNPRAFRSWMLKMDGRPLLRGLVADLLRPYLVS